MTPFSTDWRRTQAAEKGETPRAAAAADERCSASLRAKAPRGQRSRWAALVVNSQGVIVRASRAVARMFNLSLAGLAGKSIGVLVPDVIANVNSPSYTARHMAYLSGTRRWHDFRALDAAGRSFAIRVAILRLNAEVRPLFLFKLRRTEAAHESNSTSQPA